MSGLKNQPINQGMRKRTDYDNARRARLGLNIERSDGGMLQIVVETDMRSHEEEQNIQQNTFLAVVPMARLPGYENTMRRLKVGYFAPVVFTFFARANCGVSWKVTAKVSFSKWMSRTGAKLQRVAARQMSVSLLVPNNI